MPPKDTGTRRRGRKPAYEREKARKGKRHARTPPIGMDEDLALGVSMPSTCRTALGSHGDDPRPFRPKPRAEARPDPAGESSGPSEVGSPRATEAMTVSNRSNGRPSPKSFGGSRKGSRRDALREQKRRSNAHEQWVARATGGRPTPGSGALGDPGDVDAGRFRFECKQTSARSYRIRLAEVEKIQREAASCGQTPAMAFRFSGLEPGVEQDWVMLPMRAFVALQARKMGEP